MQICGDSSCWSCYYNSVMLVPQFMTLRFGFPSPCFHGYFTKCSFSSPLSLCVLLLFTVLLKASLRSAYGLIHTCINCLLQSGVILHPLCTHDCHNMIKLKLVVLNSLNKSGKLQICLQVRQNRLNIAAFNEKQNVPG